MASWTNSDGLTMYYGPEEVTASKTGEFMFRDKNRITEAKIVGTELNAFGTITYLNRNVSLDVGEIIERVELYVDTAFTSGGAATLDVGLYRTSGVAYDDNGFIEAQAVAGLTKGATIVGAGELINDTLLYKSILVCRVNVANFTAGAARLRIFSHRSEY